MTHLNRISVDPAVMDGKACVRGLRVTVDTIVGLVGSGRTRIEILSAYPYLEPEDIDEALAYVELADGREQKLILDHSMNQAKKAAKDNPY